MNAQFKTILLTVATLSLLTIALIELSGISTTALYNKYNIGDGRHDHAQQEEYINQKLEEEKDQADAVKAMPKTKISFQEEQYDFGKIKEGEKVSHQYVFTNTGDKPLMIANVIPSCGCTIPTYSKSPILPGEKGEINIEFNSINRKGVQKKNIIVVSNAERERVSIGFTVEVE